MAKRRLQNMRAIITGASSGIGWHLAKQLAGHGVRLVVSARRQDRLQQLVSEIESAGGECLPVPGDVTEPEVRRQMIVASQQHFDGLDLLVNNAGIGAMGKFVDATPDRLRQIFEVNFFALAELIREAIPLMIEGREPLIVNIGSVLGHRGVPLKSEYCASKFAVHGFSDAIRAELASSGIELLLVSPSTTDSEFFENAIDDPTGVDWTKRGAMPAEQVARKTVLAMVNRRHEIILSAKGRFMVWIDRLLPALADRMAAKYGNDP